MLAGLAIGSRLAIVSWQDPAGRTLHLGKSLNAEIIKQVVNIEFYEMQLKSTKKSSSIS